MSLNTNEMFNEEQMNARSSQYSKAVESKGTDSLVPDELVLPTKPQKERKQAVSITIRPSTLKGIKKLAKKHGYSSMSEYVNDLFEQLITLENK